jgi:protein-S-isoprenylcysteine O-methyltransferase Ste14
MSTQTFSLTIYIIVMLTGRLLSQGQRRNRQLLLSHWQSIVKDSTAMVSGFLMAIAIAYFANREIGVNWSPTIEKTQKQKLITSGIYGIVRHPLYLSGLLILVGTNIYFGSKWAWLGAILTLIALLLRIPVEEKHLIKRFGEAYIAYKRQTKAILPWIL